MAIGGGYNSAPFWPSESGRFFGPARERYPSRLHFHVLSMPVCCSAIATYSHSLTCLVFGSSSSERERFSYKPLTTHAATTLRAVLIRLRHVPLCNAGDLPCIIGDANYHGLCFSFWPVSSIATKTIRTVMQTILIALAYGFAQ